MNIVGWCFGHQITACLDTLEYILVLNEEYFSSEPLEQHIDIVHQGVIETHLGVKLNS